MKITHVMTASVVTTTRRTSLARALAAMHAGNFRRLPVVENGKLLGIITERDLREHSGYLVVTKVGAVMRSAVITVAPEASVEDAVRTMLEHKIGGLPVVDGDRLVGMVTTTDVMRAFVQMSESLPEVLNA
jgi:acetoin utilization protein AcuB